MDEPSTFPAGEDPPVAISVLHGRMLHVSRLATIGEMAAGVAHELNQPLTAIANYAQACERLLARPASDPDELREALREITAQAVRAGEILRRLRTLSGARPTERAPASLNALVAQVRELLQTDARMHGVQLRFELAEPLSPVCVDAVQIQHVIFNLVRNGLEALASAGPPRELTLRTAQHDSAHVELSVSDNGPGLSEALLARSFDPFFSTKENGTGLGLPISNSIARAHGGTLGYRPNAPRGACFVLHLPAHVEEH